MPLILGSPTYRSGKIDFAADDGLMPFGADVFNATRD
jgi:hypothetical protein